MKYSKCDFCTYESHGKCLYPEYFRNPHNLCVNKDDLDPCAPAIQRMMEIMKCEIEHSGRNVQVNKTVNHRKR